MTEHEVELLSERIAVQVTDSVAKKVEEIMSSKPCLCGIPAEQHKEFHHLIGGLGVECEHGAGMSTRKVYNALLFSDELSRFWKTFLNIAVKIIIGALIGGLILLFTSGVKINIKETIDGKSSKPIHGIHKPITNPKPSVEP